MQLAIIDIDKQAFVGTANPGYPVEAHQFLLPLPADFHPDQVAEWFFDGQDLLRDAGLVLASAKAARKARIKAEAAALINASDWRLSRVREREAAGLASSAEVAAVLAEREAVRQGSDVAEAAVDALTDVLSVHSFVWPTALAEAASA